jgi:hypothetical protein
LCLNVYWNLKINISTQWKQNETQYYDTLAFAVGSRGSSVGIATGYGLDDRWIDWSSSPGRGNNLIFSMSSKPVLVPTQPPNQWGSGALLSPGVKRPGSEADHSPPNSAEVNKT